MLLRPSLPMSSLLASLRRKLRGARSGGLLVLAVLGLVLTSCAPSVTVTLEAQAEGGIRVVQVPRHAAGDLQVETSGGKRFSVPPGHLPPPGRCRIWYPDVPPGHQPPPGDCDTLARQVPPDAVLLRR